MFNRTAPPAPETTGHDLLAEFDAAAAQFRATLAAISADAGDLVEVVDSRLRDLEAEKLVLNRLRSISPDDVMPAIAPEPEA
jgi:hypothetical protein